MLGALKSKIRDKTRDNLAAQLVALGVSAKLADRGRVEERVGKPVFHRSLGIIDISDGPMRWINIVKRDGNKHQRPAWRVVMGVPADSLVPQGPGARLRTVRKKSLPIFGRVVSVTWKGDDHGLRLVEAFSNDTAVQDLAKELGNLEVRAHGDEFQGWTVTLDRRITPTMMGWRVLQDMAQRLLSAS